MTCNLSRFTLSKMAHQAHSAMTPVIEATTVTVAATATVKQQQQKQY